MGSDIRFSIFDGSALKWKDMIRATETIPRYIDSRSQERKVRSLAQ